MLLLDSIDPSRFLFWASAFGAALIGGWHCAGMCGAFVTLAGGKRGAFLYHLGRLISYISLGLLSGQFGARLLRSIPETQRWIFTLAFGVVSLWILASRWNLGLPPSWQRYLWRKRPRHSPLEPFSVGLLNGFLPCTWLHAFLVLAAGLQNPLRGGMLLFSLWLGSLPWLLGFSFLGEQAKAFSSESVWIARIILIFTAVGILAHQIP